VARGTRSRGNGTGDSTSAESLPAGRVPPHDLEAEKAVLSAVLLANDAIHKIYTEVKPDDFYHPVHQRIYGAMLELTQENQPVDLLTLADHLKTRDQLDAVGGAVYLAELAEFEPTAANVVSHARIVRDKAVKRRLIAAATGIVEMGFDEGDRADRLLDAAESRIFEISSDNARVSFEPLAKEMQRTFDYVDAIMGRGGELTGVPTGFKKLDEMTGGLQRGDLVIIAARPSMGKTALALNIARNAALLHHKRVAVFSLEMTAQALVIRMLAGEAEVDQSKFRTGFISSHEYKKLQDAAGRLSHAELWIDDSGLVTVLEMRAKCRRLKAERGLDLVLVDYLQLAHGDSRTERREQEISEISRGLKALAKELDLPVIALSQLNRGPENRTGKDKRPMLADLRESGAIEQDADLIAFIYRDEFYNRDDPSNQGLAELIISKQRNGPTGTIELGFESRYARFTDRSDPHEGGPPVGGAGFVPPDDDFGAGADIF
jgi:replicative DNA helicase